MLAAWWSRTVMVNCSELVLPWASVALAVMVWVPMANVSPE